MPTYEYICTSCQHGWEASHSINAEPLRECPSCHELTAQRQISLGGGFILKGGGWYSDLYSSTGAAGGKGSGGGAASSGSGGGGDTKASSGGDGGSKASSGGDSGSKAAGAVA